MDEGAGVTFLDSKSSQMGKKESLEDTAKVLGRFYDGIEYRGYDQKVVEDLAKYAGVPVWNGLTDVDHPTQILADLLTIEEHVAKPLNKCKVVFVGDVRNNMAYAWMYGCAKMVRLREDGHAVRSIRTGRAVRAGRCRRRCQSS